MHRPLVMYSFYDVVTQTGYGIIPYQLNQWLPGDRLQYCPKIPKYSKIALVCIMKASMQNSRLQSSLNTFGDTAF